MASKSGLGSCTLWGLTPALNLITFLDDKTLIEADDDKKPINILLFGQSDGRHVLKTLVEHLNFRTTKKIKINIYIIESNLEAYARQLLFLNLACQPPEKIGIYEKTRQFLELFANTHLRPKTKSSLIRLARDLVKMITDDDYMAEVMPFVSLSELKFMERDGLVEICKYWIDYCDNRKENIADKWDKRLRCHLGTRYDSRPRIFDWDYHMRLMDTEGAEIISAEEYKRWRQTGLAIMEFEAEYSQPNVTLVSGASNTTNVKDLCFLGEIITGPFIAYGIECDDKTLYEKSNGRFKYSACDITVHNLEKAFTTIGDSKIKIARKATKKQKSVDGSKGLAVQQKPTLNCKVEEEEEEMLGSTFSVTFLPMESSKFLYLKKQFHAKFQLVYFSSTMAQNLIPHIVQVFAPEAVIIVEGVRHVLELRQEHIVEYEKKVEELATAVNLRKNEDDSDAYHRDYITYTLRSDSASAELPVTQEVQKIKDNVKADAESHTEADETQLIELKRPPMSVTDGDGDNETKDEYETPSVSALVMKTTSKMNEIELNEDDSDNSTDPEIIELLELQSKMLGAGEASSYTSTRTTGDRGSN